MENAAKSRLQAVQLGEAQTFKNIAIVPLIALANGTFQYRTLGGGSDRRGLRHHRNLRQRLRPGVDGGQPRQQSLPRIDDAELVGAKQNRVLNTSILLKEASETKSRSVHRGRQMVPRLQGGNVMAYRTRSRKTQSFNCSLAASGAYHSNQGEVWDGIADLQAKACAHSPTSTMNDVFKAAKTTSASATKSSNPSPTRLTSIGHGTDHRFTGKALAGTALVHENEVIHATFFHLDEIDQPERNASNRRRCRQFSE